MTNIIIRRTPILTTRTVHYSAWEPDDGHRCTTTINGRRYGRIGSRELPADLPADLPACLAAVRAWREAQHGAAYAAILVEYPELKAQEGAVQVDGYIVGDASAGRCGPPRGFHIPLPALPPAKGSTEGA